jgi:hypothetical protein
MKKELPAQTIPCVILDVVLGGYAATNQIVTIKVLGKIVLKTMSAKIINVIMIMLCIVTEHFQHARTIRHALAMHAAASIRNVLNLLMIILHTLNVEKMIMRVVKLIQTVYHSSAKKRCARAAPVVIMPAALPSAVAVAKNAW